MYVVGICKSYTMRVPLQILPLLAADFDGDVLNILYMINQQFINEVMKVFNPRNAMYINRNDGTLNMDVLHNKDTLINVNSLVYLARPNYTEDNLARIERIKQAGAA